MICFSAGSIDEINNNLSNRRIRAHYFDLFTDDVISFSVSASPEFIFDHIPVIKFCFYLLFMTHRGCLPSSLPSSPTLWHTLPLKALFQPV